MASREVHNVDEYIEIPTMDYVRYSLVSEQADAIKAFFVLKRIYISSIKSVANMELQYHVRRESNYFIFEAIENAQNIDHICALCSEQIEASCNANKTETNPENIKISDVGLNASEFKNTETQANIFGICVEKRSKERVGQHSSGNNIGENSDSCQCQ